VCLRCRPERRSDDRPDDVLAERICAYLRRHVDRAVTLEELGKLAGISGIAVHRRFQRALGLTPRQFQMDLRAGGFRQRMGEEGATPPRITDAGYDAGYSGSSQLYTKSRERLGMTPSRFRDGGRGETIEFAVSPCALGFALVASTGAGLCWVALGDAPEALEAELRQRFRHATLTAPPADGASPLGQTLAAVLDQLSAHPSVSRPSPSLPLDLRATVFQQRVWRALAAIPRGETRSYGQIAAGLGQPGAARAVARACAANPLALLVPCHRVVGGDGALRGYRWGKERKSALLEMERKLS
jgi:AraC family transcriptional regulator of adaptative response/methylated-DNA-[protein]-cysteine methyltransferase